MREHIEGRGRVEESASPFQKRGESITEKALSSFGYRVRLGRIHIPTSTRAGVSGPTHTTWEIIFF